MDEMRKRNSLKYKSEIIECDDVLSAIEEYFDRRWTDGLPVVPPTETAIEKMLEHTNRQSQEELGAVAPYGGIATIEKLAINSVMAGCRPEYFPVVIAAVEACLDPRHNLNGIQTTQNGSEQLIIVNGPIIKKLGINCGDSVFGSGYRANGTIGRALRLILWNLGRNFPGEVDRSTLSNPGAWSFCVGENEEISPWEPLHVERGLNKSSSGVTVFACEAPFPYLTNGNLKEILYCTCQAMSNPASGDHIFFHDAEILVVFGGMAAKQFHEAGWSKKDLKKYLWEHSKLPFRIIQQTGSLTAAEKAGSSFTEAWPKWIDCSDPNTLVPITQTAEEIHIIVAGGNGPWSAICYGWGGGGRAVTKKIITS